jgi:hypothetical protein
LTRSLVTCTEAKTAALQELAAPSRYSRGLATGSGTDSTIIVCNSDSAITLTDAGKHVKLGELIGRSVKAAVKEALKLQTGLSPEFQHDVLKRVSRFGITEQTLWETLGKSEPSGVEKAHFVEVIETLMRNDTLVTGVSLYAHLLDQLDWGLINATEAAEYANLLLTYMGMDGLECYDANVGIRYTVSDITTRSDVMTRYTVPLQNGLAELIKKRGDAK